MALQPYLFFTNTAKEAMTRYHEIFGGTLELMTFADMPDTESAPPGVSPDGVMHSALMFGDGDVILASDDPSGDGAGVKGAALTLMLADQDEARRLFDALAEDGVVHMELAETFWSPMFGSLVDRFGVSWMISVESEGEAS
ncbi:MAG: VOC family protein [Actinobacteria bacterium]|nr:VOC family protein [Actinomycetota bacterium]